MVNLLDGCHDVMLDRFFHAHDATNVFMFIITIDGTSKHQLKHSTKLLFVTPLRYNINSVFCSSTNSISCQLTRPYHLLNYDSPSSSLLINTIHNFNTLLLLISMKLVIHTVPVTLTGIPVYFAVQVTRTSEARMSGTFMVTCTSTNTSNSVAIGKI